MFFLPLLTQNIYQPLPKRLFKKESHYWELFLVAPDELDFTHQFLQSLLTETASLAYQARKVPVVGVFWVFFLGFCFASVVQKKQLGGIKTQFFMLDTHLKKSACTCWQYYLYIS